MAWGHPKAGSGEVVTYAAWHGSDGMSNALWITSAARKLWNSSIVLLKYGINRFALLVQNLSVKFFT